MCEHDRRRESVTIEAPAPPSPPGGRCQICGTPHQATESILCRVCGEPVLRWGWA